MNQSSHAADCICEWCKVEMEQATCQQCGAARFYHDGWRCSVGCDSGVDDEAETEKPGD